MLFSSMTFIFLFLPIVCTLYFFVKKEWQNLLLLAASFIFYAWGEPAYLSIMLLTIILNYFGALAVNRWPNHKKSLLVLSIVGNLGFLFYFKYFNFALETISDLSGHSFNFIDVVMPIGISFYTFQALSYLVDVYNNKIAVQKNIYNLALYISLFPQLIAGPIVKYHDIANQIEDREVNISKVSYGVKRFIIGLAKKILIANTMGQVADQIFALPAGEVNTQLLWVGAVCYSLQLYYDFSGYSDMAIGLGAIFGFKFLENFNYPYISKSISEFWRRWHISLSTWFKEYVYIPLGGNQVAPWRIYINLLLVFICTGFWHGASWNFIFWGLWHGFFIIFEKLIKWPKTGQKLSIAAGQHIYTILVFIFGWVLFRSENMDEASNYLEGMLGLGSGISNYTIWYYLGQKELLVLGIAIVCATPIFKNLLSFKPASTCYQVCISFWIMLLFVLSAASIAASTYNPFIYFRF